MNRRSFCVNLEIYTLNGCDVKKPAATGLNFISSGLMTERHFSTPVSPRRRHCPWSSLSCPRWAWGKTIRTDDTNDRIRRIIMPRLGLSRLYWASIRAYWAGAVEMELTESRQPGEAWARHRGARAGVFGEAPRGREIVQASIPPTSRPLQPWRRSPGRAAADRFANACGAAFAEMAPKGRCSRRASS